MKWPINIKGISSGALITLIDQAMVSGTNFLIGILAARLMGVESYGLYVLLWMAIILTSSLQQALLIKPMMSFAPKYGEEKLSSYDIDCFLIQIGLLIAGGLAGVFAIVLSQALILDIAPQLIGWLVLAGLAFLMQEYLRRRAFVKGKAQLALVLDGIAYLGWLSLVAFSYLKGEISIIWLLKSNAIAFGVACFFGLGGLDLAKVSFKRLKDTLRDHWGFSKWLVGTALLQFGSGNYFIITAAAMLGPAAAGALRIVQNILGITHILFLALENRIPTISSGVYHREGESGLKKYLQHVGMKTGFAYALLLLVLVLINPYLLKWIYGPQTVQYSYLFVGYALCYLIMFPGYFLRWGLRALEYTSPMFGAYLISTAFSILTATLFVRHFELSGVIAGLICTQILIQGYFISLLKFRPKATTR